MIRNKLYPEVRALLEAIEAEGGPAIETMSPEAARLAVVDALKAVAGEPEEIGNVQDVKIPQSEYPIPVRIYRPAGAGPFACLVYFHGGGWVVCDLDTHDVACRAIARRAGAVVVAVDYRLSPEHRFPAAVTDGYAAIEWVTANAASLAVDPRRIAVGGDSAGGNLSAVMCLKIARLFGGSPELWVRLQATYDLKKSEQNKKIMARVARIVPIASVEMGI